MSDRLISLAELIEAGYSRKELHRLGAVERVGLERAGVRVPEDEDE